MTTPTAETAWTYLQLCQRTAVECGVANASLNPAPGSVVGQTGELLRVCNYVADAWRELQGRILWSWMWEVGTVTVPAGASKVAVGIAADRWIKRGVRIPGPPTSDGRFLDYIEWQDFALLYATQYAGNSIGAWTIDPAGNFCINGLAPAGGFTVLAQRYANPTALRLDTDVPGLPADLQMILVYKAMRKYAGFDEAGTQRALALDEERSLMADLQNRCLPTIQFGGSLLDQYGGW